MGESTTDGEPRLDDDTPFEDELRKDEDRKDEVRERREARERRASGESGGEQGAPHTGVGRFMRTMGHLRSVYGPAAHRDPLEAEAHGHNPEDVKNSEELDGIDIQTDSEGHHYGVRREPGSEPREG
ncbi:hypothetical protein [Sinomonas sp. ASV322]|uniref:hypothetical protein n=1 Tax=Sinomonas sp. ASV322 TaxID=3041920 RepID=UPI0027DAEFA4|nr:hypothetical protein [Sinomonas sp. ASV322]MDQ4503150.1 hypothetical protein [Sinomonas sp. ASV322]